MSSQRVSATRAAILPQGCGAQGVERSRPVPGTAGASRPVTCGRNLIIAFVSAALLCTPVSAPADPRLAALPQFSLFETPPIKAFGLKPLEPIELRVTTTDSSGALFQSRSRYIADLSGEVDTRSSVANGSYDGIDVAGPFWSQSAERPGLDLPLVGSLPTQIELYDGESRLAAASAQRVIVPEGVTVTQLRRPISPIVANFYHQTGSGKRPAIITLTGSNGGIDPRFAPFLASHGYDVLAVGYFHGPGLPDDLIEIPLEYFRDAIDWVARRPDNNGKIGLVGVSKGAEAALATAAYFGRRVSAVAAFVPSSVVWEGADSRARFGHDPKFEAPGKSSWSLGGRPLPFVRKVITAERLAHRPVQFLDAYAPALDRPRDARASIPVARYTGPIFLAAAGNDLAWPSVRMAHELRRRVLAHRRRAAIELAEYPIAGHFFGPPGLPSNFAQGGTARANAEASRDSCARLLAFLKRHLG